VIGLLVFMGAAGYVVWELGQRARVRGQRAEGRGQRNAANETLAVCLMVSFAGYSVMCLFMHLWSNEAVMAQWWLAAGLSLGMGATGGQKESARRT
jgi:hypothetical protein